MDEVLSTSGRFIAGGTVRARVGLAVLLVLAAVLAGCFKPVETGPPLEPTLTDPPVNGGRALEGVGYRLADRLLPQAPVQKILATAYSKTGLPYRRGGTSPETGFDCAGFAQWVFTQNGVSLPRTPEDQLAFGQPVNKAELKPGDLVFYRTSWLHVGIYSGDGLFIHSPHTGDRVKESKAFDRHHRTHFVGARRVIHDANAAPLSARRKESIVKAALAAYGVEEKEKSVVEKKPAERPDKKKADVPRVYVVKSGDTIWTVARRFGVSKKSLLKANGLKENHILQIGQKLTLPHS